MWGGVSPTTACKMTAVVFALLIMPEAQYKLPEHTLEVSLLAVQLLAL